MPKHVGVVLLGVIRSNLGKEATYDRYDDESSGLLSAKGIRLRIKINE
jgi:hypothetical protein